MGEGDKGMGKYDGMTTNERLFNAGLLDVWKRAATARNRAEMIEILGQIGLADQADVVVETILANPAKYGF